MLRGKDMDSDNVIAQNRLKLYILWDLDMLKNINMHSTIITKSVLS